MQCLSLAVESAPARLAVGSFNANTLCKRESDVDTDRPKTTALGTALQRAAHQRFDGEPKVLDDPVIAGLLDDSDWAHLDVLPGGLNEQQMLIACIAERARRLQLPVDLPVPRDRATLQQLLSAFGTELIREISDPTVIGVFRLAIVEAVHAPEVARALDSIGRETSRTAVRDIMARAQASALLDGRPAELADQFGDLLLGDLMISLLLGLTTRPSSRESAERARAAADAFLQLHSPPDNATGLVPA
jgi:hypothetical protein